MNWWEKEGWKILGVIAFILIGFLGGMIGYDLKQCPKCPNYKVIDSGKQLEVSPCDSLIVWVKEIQKCQDSGYTFMEYIMAYPHRLNQYWCFYQMGINNVSDLWQIVRLELVKK